jgi:hypothetical protein
MNPHTYGHLSLTREQNHPVEKSTFNKWCCFYCKSACRRLQIDPFLSPCTQLKSKWFKNLHIKSDTLKLIEEKVGKRLEHIGTEIILNRTMAYALKLTTDKWDLIKLQSFCKVKDIANKTKGNQQISTRSLPILYPIKGYYQIYTKNSRS